MRRLYGNTLYYKRLHEFIPNRLLMVYLFNRVISQYAYMKD